jgi:hypothetical protein
VSQDIVIGRNKPKTTSKTKNKKIGEGMLHLFNDKIEREITSTTASKLVSREWDEK